MNWRLNVQPVIDSILNNFGVPGMIVAVKRDDRPTEYLAAGTDAREHPLNADTLIPVASVTKLATALAALRLADADKLKLDDPLALCLPEILDVRSCYQEESQDFEKNTFKQFLQG